MTGSESVTTLFDRLAEEVTPMRWAVQGLIPEGVTLLIGKPKVGKSFFLLQSGQTVAEAESLLGHAAAGGDVLYLALEDNDRRLQHRARKQLGDRPGSRRFHLATRWPKLDQGGLEAIHRWLDEHPQAALVIIDTLALIRSNTRTGSVYDDEYAALAPLRELADRYGVAVLCVVHERKAESANVVDSAVSSTGLPGAADNLLQLTREPGKATGRLAGVGRDIGEISLPLRFEADTLTWVPDGRPNRLAKAAKEEGHLLAFRKLRPHLEADPGANVTALCRAAGIRRASFAGWRARWVDRGWLTADGQLTDLGRAA